MMKISFDNPALGYLHMKVPEEKVLTQVEALIKLGFEPVVEMDDEIQDT